METSLGQINWFDMFDSFVSAENEKDCRSMRKRLVDLTKFIRLACKNHIEHISCSTPYEWDRTEYLSINYNIISVEM